MGDGRGGGVGGRDGRGGVANGVVVEFKARGRDRVANGGAPNDGGPDSRGADDAGRDGGGGGSSRSSSGGGGRPFFQQGRQGDFGSDNVQVAVGCWPTVFKVAAFGGGHAPGDAHLEVVFSTRRTNERQMRER